MSGRSQVALAFIFAVVLISSALVVGYPRNTSAVLGAANFACMGCDPAGKNGRLCSSIPCSDSTSGFTAASGMCVQSGVCLATATNGGGITQIAQLLTGIAQLMAAMQAGGGAGGGGAGGTGGVGGCERYYAVSVPSSDPCSYYDSGAASTTSPVNFTDTTTTGGSGSSAVSDLISSLNGTGSTNTNTNTGTTNTTDSNIASTTAVASVPIQGGSVVPGANTSVPQSAFGTSPGFSGDIQVFTGNRVTIVASNRDVPGNKQSVGFYGSSGVPGQLPQVIYTSVCAARPWAGNFLAAIIPASVLDNSCTSHGYAVGPPSLAPAAVVSAPKTVVAPTPSPVPATVYVAPLRADIWAVPPTVSSGARTSIFWNSTGASSCAITSSDNNFSQNALTGQASSLPLTKNTTFSISCTAATSTVTNQVVVIVQ